MQLTCFHSVFLSTLVFFSQNVTGMTFNSNDKFPYNTNNYDIFNPKTLSNNRYTNPSTVHRSGTDTSAYYSPYVENKPQLESIENKIQRLVPGDVKNKLLRGIKSDLTKKPRLSLAEWGSYNIPEPEGPGTYAWGYDIEDPDTGNIQFRSEEKHANGSITGSYGHVAPDGTVQVVHYIADNLGYRARVENSGSKTTQSPYENNNQLSPQMASALYNLNQPNYGHQVLEQHQRPIDKQKSYELDMKTYRNQIPSVGVPTVPRSTDGYYKTNIYNSRSQNSLY